MLIVAPPQLWAGVVAQNSLVFVSAKKGRQYDLGSTTIKIDPVHEADILYLGTDGLIHLHEVKLVLTKEGTRRRLFVEQAKEETQTV